MASISLFTILRQIRQACFWLANEKEFEGRAVNVIAMKKRIKIVLDNGKSFCWAFSQARCDDIALSFMSSRQLGGMS
jgi:hypothetical protein